MQSFGDILSAIIEHKDINKKALCERLGIDRTLLYRYMANKAVMPEETLDKLTDELMLMPSENEKLLDAYNASMIGLDRYQCRKIIDSMFRTLDKGDEIPNDILVEEGYYYPQAGSTFAGQAQAINGTANIQAVVKYIFEATQPKDAVYINAQPNNELITINIYDLLRSKRDVSIYHIFRLIQNPTVDIPAPYAMNLQHIKGVLRNTFPLGGRNYFPSYYYFYFLDTLPSHSIIHPNVIVASNHLLFFSSDNEKAILLSEPNIVKIYQEEMQRMLKITSPFFQILDLTKVSAGAYFSKICHVGELSISPEPISLIARLSLLRENRRIGLESLKDAAIDKFIARRHEAIIKGVPIRICFTLEGLDHLVRTGLISDMGIDLMEPMNKVQIKKYLEIIYGYSAKFPNVSINLIHDDSLNFFMRNYTRVFSNSMISFTSSECNYNSAYTIHEKSIVQSFSDYFFHVLPANISMESKENTMELLRNRIDQITTE